MVLAPHQKVLVPPHILGPDRQSPGRPRLRSAFARGGRTGAGPAGRAEPSLGPPDTKSGRGLGLRVGGAQGPSWHAWTPERADTRHTHCPGERGRPGFPPGPQPHVRREPPAPRFVSPSVTTGPCGAGGSRALRVPPAAPCGGWGWEPRASLGFGAGVASPAASRCPRGSAGLGEGVPAPLPGRRRAAGQPARARETVLGKPLSFSPGEQPGWGVLSTDGGFLAVCRVLLERAGGRTRGSANSVPGNCGARATLPRWLRALQNARDRSLEPSCFSSE